MATVHPGPGDDIATVAATLLGLAASERDVVFIPEDAAFAVPDELAHRYIKAQQPEPEPDPAPAPDPDPDPEPEPEPTPPPAARRRPHRRTRPAQEE